MADTIYHQSLDIILSCEPYRINFEAIFILPPVIEGEKKRAKKKKKKKKNISSQKNFSDPTLIRPDPSEFLGKKTKRPGSCIRDTRVGSISIEK